MVPASAPNTPGESQSSRALAAEAAANAASPAVSQPMPANRHDPITSVLSASSSVRHPTAPLETGRVWSGAPTNFNRHSPRSS